MEVERFHELHLFLWPSKEVDYATKEMLGKVGLNENISDTAAISATKYGTDYHRIHCC